MLSGLAQRVGNPWMVIGLGLATPLLAVGALVMVNGGDTDHEVVTAASDRAPTVMPVGPTSTTMYVLTPGKTPPTTSGGKSGSSEQSSSKGSGSSAGSSSKGSNSGSSKSSKSSGSSSSSKGKSSKSSGSKSSTTRYSGSTGGVTTTTRRSSPTTGGGSGGGVSGGGATTTAPPATTTTTPSGPTVLLLDPMSYSGDLTSSPFGFWSLVSVGGGSAQGTGDAVDLTAAPGDRALAVIGGPYDDLDLSVDVTSLGQGGGADTAWVVWDYTAPDSFLALYVGADGWGIVAVSSGGVQVLNSDTTPTLGVLGTATVRVVQVGSLILASADGVALGAANAGDAYSPTGPGAIGVAASGSSARFDNVVLRTT